MRDEWTSRRTPVLHLQHGGLHLEVVVRPERRPKTRVDSGASAHGGAGLVANDEVEVAAADPALLVELGVGIGERQDRLGRDRPVVDHDRQLTAAAGDDLPVHEDVVPEIDELLPARERLLTDLGERDHRLDARTVACLQRGETELAGVPAEDHAPRDADDHAGFGTGLEFAVFGAQRRDLMRHRHSDRERPATGIRSLLNEAFPLGQADRLLLEDVLSGVVSGGCGRVRRGGHSGSLKVAFEFTGRTCAPLAGPGREVAS